MKITPLLVLVAALSGCASEPRPLDTYDVSRARRVLTLYDSGAFSTNHLFVFADDRVGVDVYQPQNVSPGETRYVIAKQVWKTLDAKTAALAWKQVEELKISEWKEQYLPKDLGMVISDGTQWWIIFREGGREKMSGGDNVYPAVSPPGAPTLEIESLTGKSLPTGYHSLLRLLRDLTEKG